MPVENFPKERGRDSIVARETMTEERTKIGGPRIGDSIERIKYELKKKKPTKTTILFMSRNARLKNDRASHRTNLRYVAQYFE